ncbi:MAG TPA: hypothetical protein VIM86_04135 [Thermodesulfobacteriota bacterium]
MSIPFVRLDAIACPACAMPILLKARPLSPQTIPCPNCHAKVEVQAVPAADGSRTILRWRRAGEPAWQEREVNH